MAQFSTKMKIILFVFGVIACIYVIQFFITSVSNSSKRESFENDDDEAPNEKPTTTKSTAKANTKSAIKLEKDSPKNKITKESDEEEEEEKPKKNKSIIDKEIKLNVLEQVENIFDKMYPKSDKKPIIFDMLMDKEHFEELKAKHENGESMGNYIKKVIQQTMNSMEKDKIDQFKQEDDRPIDVIMEKLDESESKNKLMSQLEDVVTKISHIQNELKKIGLDAVDVEPKTKSQKGNKDLIEGFENRLNYASY